MPLSPSAVLNTVLPQGTPGLSAGPGARVLSPARSLSQGGVPELALLGRLLASALHPSPSMVMETSSCLLAYCWGVGEPRPAGPPAPGRGSSQGAGGPGRIRSCLPACPRWGPSCSSHTTPPRALSQTRAPVPRLPHPQPSVSVTRTAPQRCLQPSVNLANSWSGPHCAPRTSWDEEVLPQGPRPEAQGSRLGKAARSVPRPSRVFTCVCCSLSSGNASLPPLRTVPLTGSHATLLRAALHDCLVPLPEGLPCCPRACGTRQLPQARPRLPRPHPPGVVDLTWLSHGRRARALLLSPQADLGSLPEIENSLAVFCMATYGEGDPTDNAQDFYDWLQETDLDLSGVKYAVSHPSFPAAACPACGTSPGHLAPLCVRSHLQSHQPGLRTEGFKLGVPGGETRGKAAPGTALLSARPPTLLPGTLGAGDYRRERWTRLAQIRPGQEHPVG